MEIIKHIVKNWLIFFLLLSAFIILNITYTLPLIVDNFIPFVIVLVFMLNNNLYSKSTLKKIIINEEFDSDIRNKQDFFEKLLFHGFGILCIVLLTIGTLNYFKPVAYPSAFIIIFITIIFLSIIFPLEAVNKTNIQEKEYKALSTTIGIAFCIAYPVYFFTKKGRGKGFFALLGVILFLLGFILWLLGGKKIGYIH